MDELREVAKDCINIKQEEFQINSIKAEIISAMYFIILENGEIKRSESDLLLNHLGIEFAFIFPKISYTPMVNWYKSYLSPIIINRDLEVVEQQLMINDWIFEYSGQFHERTPTPIHVTTINNKFDFEEQQSVSVEGSDERLINSFKFVYTVFKYGSKTEFEYLKLILKKDQIIADLRFKNERFKEGLLIK